MEPIFSPTIRQPPYAEKVAVGDKAAMILDLDHSVIPMVDRMQSTGMLISPAFFHAFSRELAGMLEQKQAEITSHVGRHLNPNSSPQVAQYLFGECGIESFKKTPAGAWQADDKVLSGLRDVNKAVGMILDYRELHTLKTRYVDRIPICADPDGRVRPDLRITRVPTGRLAASHPRRLNLLAIPTRTEIGKRVREGFVAPKGKMLFSIDLDQIEMRVTASEAVDQGMVALFWRAESDPKNPENDIHRLSARDCFGVSLNEVTAEQRQVGKTVGFGVLNDMAEKGLLDQFRLYDIYRDPANKIRYTEAEAKAFITRWHDARPAVRDWKDHNRAHARRYGWIEDMWGRRRYCPQVVSSVERIRAEGLREIVNHPIQGGAQGIIKTGMAMIWERFFTDASGDWPDFAAAGAEPLLQIHDELLFEVPQEMVDEFGAAVSGCLAQAGEGKMIVPVGSKWGVGETWGAIKK